MTRHLVICTDGTWNRPDQEDRGRIVPSNVVKVCRAVSGQTKNGIEQLIYYDTGVGTGGRWDRIKGGAFGVGLSDNVKQAYEALGNEFKAEDKLFLFGFSRGAYTARSLAGLIGLCGIPDRKKGDVKECVEKAFKIYRMKPEKKKDLRERQAKEHREACSHADGNGNIINEIIFIGVWDTVGALGVPVKGLTWIARRKHKFHDLTLGSHIKNAYHAVAIDERRGPFEPALWLEKSQSLGQTVEQVWFPGVHSNIGGGYVDVGLSDRALLWVCLKACDNGLGFDEAYMSRRVDPNYHGELRDSMSWGYSFIAPVTRRGPVARQIGGTRKADDGRRYRAAGEMIHYTAKQRFCHTTEALYHDRHANENLSVALKSQSPPIATSMPAERGFHAGVQINWNGDKSTARSF